MIIKNIENMHKKSETTVKGSVTVEAALSLFLFLTFFICMIYFYLILNMEMRVQSALEQTADAQAAYAAIKDYHDEDGSLSYIQCGLDYTFAKSNVIRLLGQEYLDSSWIEGGKGGLYFEKSNFLSDGATINLIVHYKIKIPLFPVPEIQVVQRTRRRIWIGEDTSYLRKTRASSGKVYVTPTGNAYHLYADCDYIDVKLQAVSAGQLSSMRNKDGSIYYVCESCHPQTQGIVYITAYGNRYHVSGSCPAIEKDVIQVDEDEIGDRHLCSKCLKRSGGI